MNLRSGFGPWLRWVILGTLWVAPQLLVWAAGWIWLGEQGLVAAWFLAYLALAAVAVVVTAWLQPTVTPHIDAHVPDSPYWPPAGEAAKKQVEKLATSLQDEGLILDTPDKYWRVLREVLETVAGEFNPGSRAAHLEVTVHDALLVAEMVARDLRGDLRKLPVAEKLTLHNYVKLSGWFTTSRDWYVRLYPLYRVGHLLVSPVAALVREAKDQVVGNFLTTSIDEFYRWLLIRYVEKAGFWAIELYSGNLSLVDPQMIGFKSPQAVADVEREQTREKVLAEEPLRVLIFGQVKAGKSSLVNALFGGQRAPVDVLPTTRDMEPYLLEREGVGRALVFDTAGYADVANLGAKYAPLRDQLLRIDLCLLVCSAASATRDADRQQLDGLRALYESAPERLPPPIVVVLTHIDRLRPLQEWSPPYDLKEPSPGTKAARIAAAVAAVSKELDVEPQRVVPVCLAPGSSPYNVEESLVPTIMASLGEAERAKVLRCLREYRSGADWQAQLRRAIDTGGVLVAYARDALLKSSGPGGPPALEIKPPAK